jgi:hypothetical protein
MSAGATPSMRTSGWFAPGAQTVRAGAEGHLFRSRVCQGGEILGCILVLVGHQDVSNQRRTEGSWIFEVEEG